eukprot:scaffold67545_cov30-Tisochrysis_lutea.AAC.4
MAISGRVHRRRSRDCTTIRAWLLRGGNSGHGRSGRSPVADHIDGIGCEGCEREKLLVHHSSARHELGRIHIRRPRRQMPALLALPAAGALGLLPPRPTLAVLLAQLHSRARIVSHQGCRARRVWFP